MGSMPESSGVREVKSAARTVALLELLAGRGDRPARLDELAAQLGVPRSSMYQLLQTLVDRGWVRADAAALYGVGIRALLTGTSYLDSDRHVRVVRPYLDEASDALGETIHLARLDGADVVYLATRESHEYARALARVGRRVPAHAGALGKALLAERPDSELRFPAGEPSPLCTENTHTESATLLADLAEVRERGYYHRPRGDGARHRGLRLRPALRHAGRRRDQLLGPGGPAHRRARGPYRRRHAGDADEDRVPAVARLGAPDWR